MLSLGLLLEKYRCKKEAGAGPRTTYSTSAASRWIIGSFCGMSYGPLPSGGHRLSWVRMAHIPSAEHHQVEIKLSDWVFNAIRGKEVLTCIRTTSG